MTDRSGRLTANQIWCEIVALAGDLTAWLQLLGCTDPADQTAHQAGSATCPPLAADRTTAPPQRPEPVGPGTEPNPSALGATVPPLRQSEPPASTMTSPLPPHIKIMKDPG